MMIWSQLPLQSGDIPLETVFLMYIIIIVT